MTISAIEDAVERGRMRVPRPTYGYYRQPNGWITVAAVTDLEELKYRREGWEPLPQYGRFQMAHEYAADHPLEALFMQGGAHELPIDQVIESGFHLNPPVVPSCRQLLTQNHARHDAACMRGARPVDFPQLEGWDGESFQCRFCDRPPFPTEKARGQHEGVMHKDEKSDIRTGQTLADALIQGFGGRVPQAMAVEEETEEAEHPFWCAVHGIGFDEVAGLTGHVKDHHGRQGDGEAETA